MKTNTRDRLVLPVLLPLGVLVVIALVLWGFSRILLSLTHTAATATALTAAAGIVIISAAAAARPQVRGSTIAAMIAGTAGVAMLAGGIALAVVSGGEEEGGPGAGNVVGLVALNIAFDKATLTVPAGEPFTIAFENKDANTQHNVGIFDNPDHSGTPLFEGDLVTGPAEADYAVDALEAGIYFFRCIVHPSMAGEIDAVEGGGGGGGGGGGITVVAQNLAFDTGTIELTADTPSTITFDNRDAGVQHNISIYSDDTLAELLFQGDLVAGPVTVEYAIPPLPAGEYYFHCDVHPTMNGTVRVG